MKQQFNSSIFAKAFVLKNFIPERYKVILLHEVLGKITCVYKKYERASRLCTGAQIICTVEQRQNWYEIIQFDLLFIPEKLALEGLHFVHNISKLCLHLLPANVAVGELFTFLLYVYQHFEELTEQSECIILLRIFLLFDILPENKNMYRCALLDPYEKITQSDDDLMHYVDICWQQFYQQV